MPEPGFREIQLNTKQVVFLFIALLTAGIGIFLLGVSAGKRVAQDRPGEVVQTQDPAAGITVSGGMPPATSLKPDELKYHEELQGKGAKSATAPPTPPDAPPDSTPTLTPTPTPSPAPLVKPAPAQGAGGKPAPAAGGYYVQVDSFGSRANADRQVTQLKGRGFAAFVYESPLPGPKFNVRVGPFADLASADVMKARLTKEGFRPSVTR
jgi:cell division septation protein DedD